MAKKTHNTKLVQFRCSPGIHDGLQWLAAQENTTVAEYMRRQALALVVKAGPEALENWLRSQHPAA